MVGTVDHDRRKPHVDTVSAKFKGVPVIQVEGRGNVIPEFLGIGRGALGHIPQKGLVGIFPGAGRDLEDHRRPGFHASLDNGLELLHIVEIIGGNRITARCRLFEHVPGIDKPEVLITDHDSPLLMVIRP